MNLKNKRDYFLFYLGDSIDRSAILQFIKVEVLPFYLFIDFFKEGVLLEVINVVGVGKLDHLLLPVNVELNYLFTYFFNEFGNQSDQPAHAGVVKQRLTLHNSVLRVHYKLEQFL